MNNKVIEKSIKRALIEAPSLDFADIINTPYSKMTEHDFITRQSESKKVSYPKQFAVGFVSFAILLLCLTGWFVQYRLPDSSIMLDVNPSIKIVTNKQDRILSIEALNADAEIVLDNISDRSTDLNQMVPLIVSSIINQGYLNSEKNVVMVSVENKSTEKANALASSIHQLIQASALSQNIDAQILQQTLQKDKEAATLANRYHISDGKIRLIMRILASNPKYTMEALASKSMEELLNIAMDNQVDLTDLLQGGHSSDKTSTNVVTPTGMPSTGIAPTKDNTNDNSAEVSDEDKDDDGQNNNDKDNNNEDLDNEKDDNQSPGKDQEDGRSKSDDSKKYNHSTKPSTEKEEDSSPSNNTSNQDENSQEDNNNGSSDNDEYDNENNSEDDQSNASSSDVVENNSEEDDTSSELSVKDSDSSDGSQLGDNSSDHEGSDDDNSDRTSEND
ncbi:MAG: uncharacterized protein H6Q59_3485 [Firmicutes bacterium]|nr:uncharacterized protein [Bacillota bacterium]